MPLSRKNKEQIFRLAPASVVILFLIALPLFVDLAFISLFTKILIFGLLVMSLDLLVGYTGLLAFGHAAFFGIAAYTTAILTRHYNIASFWLAAPHGGIMAV